MKGRKNMRELEQIRREISENDRLIAKLFEKRMNLAGEVAEYKKENNMAVFDASREEKVIDNFISEVNDIHKESAKKLIISLMQYSKEYQNEVLK